MCSSSQCRSSKGWSREPTCSILLSAPFVSSKIPSACASSNKGAVRLFRSEALLVLMTTLGTPTLEDFAPPREDRIRGTESAGPRPSETPEFWWWRTKELASDTLFEEVDGISLSCGVAPSVAAGEPSCLPAPPPSPALAAPPPLAAPSRGGVPVCRMKFAFGTKSGGILMITLIRFLTLSNSSTSRISKSRNGTSSPVSRSGHKFFSGTAAAADCLSHSLRRAAACSSVSPWFGENKASSA
mmetsp:Transcript_26245/g.66138  ORF Transcript_26245/g.66138 Transcript_26245/m.66138 type:complete len:242 (+) Transcript_26245:3952-4677(+)